MLLVHHPDSCRNPYNMSRLLEDSVLDILYKSGTKNWFQGSEVWMLMLLSCKLSWWRSKGSDQLNNMYEERIHHLPGTAATNMYGHMTPKTQPNKTSKTLFYWQLWPETLAVWLKIWKFHLAQQAIPLLFSKLGCWTFLGFLDLLPHCIEHLGTNVINSINLQGQLFKVSRIVHCFVAESGNHGPPPAPEIAKPWLATEYLHPVRSKFVKQLW